MPYNQHCSNTRDCTLCKISDAALNGNTVIPEQEYDDDIAYLAMELATLCHDGNEGEEDRYHDVPTPSGMSIPIRNSSESPSPPNPSSILLNSPETSTAGDSATSSSLPLSDPTTDNLTDLDMEEDLRALSTLSALESRFLARKREFFELKAALEREWAAEMAHHADDLEDADDDGDDSGSGSGSGSSENEEDIERREMETERRKQWAREAAAVVRQWEMEMLMELRNLIGEE